jgi:hypothetical protein
VAGADRIAGGIPAVIDLVPLPPHPRYGRPLPLLAVWDGDRLLGYVAEVEPLRWWWRGRQMAHFAPAHGPSQRDCVEMLLLVRDLPPPPRRGIPATLTIVRPEVPADGDG